MAATEELALAISAIGSHLPSDLTIMQQHAHARKQHLLVVQRSNKLFQMLGAAAKRELDEREAEMRSKEELIESEAPELFARVCEGELSANAAMRFQISRSLFADLSCTGTYSTRF
jgi:hypothetical protein